MAKNINVNQERIVFDLDGVLLNSEEDLDWLDEALRCALKELDIEDTPENVKKLYPGRVSEFRRVVRGFSHKPEIIWQVRDKHYVDKKVSMIEKGNMCPFDDVDSLRELKDRYILGIISNSPQIVVEEFVQSYSYSDFFSFWLGRGSKLSDLNKIKPHPYLYNKMIEQIGEGLTWYVGDRDLDEEFAQNTGMKFLLVSRNSTGFANLRQLVDYFLKYRVSDG